MALLMAPPMAGRSECNHESDSNKKQVRFGPVAINEFPVILGDYIPRDGPPIALDAKATRIWAVSNVSAPNAVDGTSYC
jgi:hypothetical protein